MPFYHCRYIWELVARRSFAWVTGILAAGLMLAATPVAAQVSHKSPAERPALRVDKVRVQELREKRTHQPATPDNMREWHDAKPTAPVQRGELENALIRKKLHSDIVRQIEPCWSVPVGARNAENLKVMLRVYLLPDGALAGLPVILGQEHKSDKFHHIAAESARRAVQRCAPLKLPAETYDIWREIELVFDPGGMLGD